MTDFFCIHAQLDLSKKARLMATSYNDSSDEDWWSEWYQKNNPRIAFLKCLCQSVSSRFAIVRHVPCHLKYLHWHSQDTRVCINKLNLTTFSRIRLQKSLRLVQNFEINRSNKLDCFVLFLLYYGRVTDISHKLNSLNFNWTWSKWYHSTALTGSGSMIINASVMKNAAWNS